MHETASPKPLADARLIPLAAISTSPTNPRAGVAKEDFAELAASIKEKGVLEPILVRPSARNGTAFEIVAGERRFRASRLAGLPAIPAVVREMTDAEAAEIALVENLHRKDIGALDEAAGYKKLQEQHRYSIDDVALKVGKSRSHVAARLRLLALPEAARKALLAGEMPPSVALLIARIPVPALAERAAKEILHGGHVYGQPAGEPMTYRRASEHVRRTYMLSLAGAPFATDDKTLVPEAGPCASCPKRTGNQRELFADVEKQDTCSDPECFGTKRDAAWKRAQAEAASKGIEVVPDKDAKRLFYAGGQLAHGTRYVDLKDACEEGPKERNWQRLLGKHAPKPVLARDEEGCVHRLVTRGEAVKALKAAGHRFAVQAEKDGNASERYARQAREQQKKQREREEMLRAVSRAAIGQVVAKAEAQPPALPFWQIALTSLVRGSWHDTLAEVVKRRGWSEKKSRPEDVARRHAREMKEPETRALVLEILVTRFALPHWSSATFGEDLRAACKLYGVDLAKLTVKEKAARAVKAREKPKTKTAAKKPAKK